MLVPLLFAVEMFLLGLRNEERRGKKCDGLDRALFFKHHVVSHQYTAHYRNLFYKLE